MSEHGGIMKKVICIILVVLFVLPLTACGAEQPEKLAPLRKDFGFIDEFLKTYKNEDVAQTILDPSEFLIEWRKVATFRADKSTALDYFKLWDEANSLDLYGDAVYNKDVVLLDIPVTIRAEIAERDDDPNVVEGYFNISISSIDEAAGYKFALACYDFMSKAADLKGLDINYNEVSPEDFQKERSENVIIRDFTARFSDDGKVSFYSSEYGSMIIFQIY